MAKKNSFLLVSLDEAQAKELAQVISNDTCRKILDFLASKEDITESELSEQLQMPMSTVHYNLQQLVKGNLVSAETYHYSQKGREILHYKLANKYIIIAPKSTYGIKEKLKSILPTIGIIGGIALVMRYFNTFASKSISSLSEASFEESARAELMKTSADYSIAEVLAQAPVNEPSIWAYNSVWFAIGACLALFVYVIIEKLRKQ